MEQAVWRVKVQTVELFYGFLKLTISDIRCETLSAVPFGEGLVMKSGPGLYRLDHWCLSQMSEGWIGPMVPSLEQSGLRLDQRGPE